jgi:hypothetical protein
LKRGITPDWNMPHSITDEVFSWMSEKSNKEAVLSRGNAIPENKNEYDPMAPKKKMDFSQFSPMTISRSVVSG